MDVVCNIFNLGIIRRKHITLLCFYFPGNLEKWLFIHMEFHDLICYLYDTGETGNIYVTLTEYSLYGNYMQIKKMECFYSTLWEHFT